MPGFFEKFIRPVLFRLNAETAHDVGIATLRYGLASDTAQRLATKNSQFESFGAIERFGLKFASPLGVAAGFDKNGVVINQLAALGFGFVEVGTVTHEPQTGNRKPRLFRLPQDKALINRLGFNNDGAKGIAERLKDRKTNCIVGVNIGRNRDVSNDAAVENYLKTFELVHPFADYVTVNVSSPNTPDLRELQRPENLEELLEAIQKRNLELGAKPLLVKIAPDLTEGEIEMVVDTCIRFEISGIVATNTTIARDGLKTPGLDKFGAGGLSGKPLAHRSNEVISHIYRFSNGRLPIIGVGGIFTAKDAFEKIEAGACLLQAYTGFIYTGPSFAETVNAGLAQMLNEKGFRNLDEAVGSAIS